MAHSKQMSFEELAGAFARLEDLVVVLQKRVAELEAENEFLRNGGPKPPTINVLPPFVKRNRVKIDDEGKKSRKVRDRGFARPASAESSRTEIHSVKDCPDCGRSLAGGWVHCSREVIDIPVVTFEVIKHVFLARRCGVCKKRYVPHSNEALASHSVGRHRMGTRLMSLIAYMSTVCRMPIRQIKRLLASLFGLEISEGGIVHLLQSVAKAGSEIYDELRNKVRGSPFVHADETGWREDGINGYLWSFSTDNIRYFHRNQSRGNMVPKDVLGENYQGIIISDFYSAYSYHTGLHQRCWVHLLRDVKDLTEGHPEDECLRRWSNRLHEIYTDATSCCYVSLKARVSARERFQRELVALARPYAELDKEIAPQATLAKRLLRFEPEMFTFVEYPFISPNNNAAERAIRPAVINRKVSGGTRSKVGSDTKAILMSLFGTWNLQEQDTLTACWKMLSAAK